MQAPASGRWSASHSPWLLGMTPSPRRRARSSTGATIAGRVAAPGEDVGDVVVDQRRRSRVVRRSRRPSRATSTASNSASLRPERRVDPIPVRAPRAPSSRRAPRPRPAARPPTTHPGEPVQPVGVVRRDPESDRGPHPVGQQRGAGQRVRAAAGVADDANRSIPSASATAATSPGDRRHHAPGAGWIRRTRAGRTTPSGSRATRRPSNSGAGGAPEVWSAGCQTTQRPSSPGCRCRTRAACGRRPAADRTRSRRSP